MTSTPPGPAAPLDPYSVWAPPSQPPIDAGPGGPVYPVHGVPPGGPVVLGPAGQPLPRWSPTPPPPPGTDPLAVAALVLGLLALVPVAVPLAIIALVRVRRTGRAGTGLAVGALVASVAWTLVGAVAAVVVLAGPAMDAAMDPWPPSGPAAVVSSLEVGDCFDLPARDEVAATVTECSAPHDGEVYEQWTLTPSADAAEKDVRLQADDRCYTRFESYVGSSYDWSSLGYEYYLPDHLERADGERTVTCVVVPFDDEVLRGSVKDSGR